MKVHAWLRVAALLLCQGLCHCSYLLISSPQDKAVYYAPLLSAAEQGRGERLAVSALTSPGDLEHPLGMAVDATRQVLYVADRAARSVVAFHLFEEGRRAGRAARLAAEDPRVVVSGLEVHWVAVDAMGTLFCSDDEGNAIWSMPASAMATRLRGLEAPKPLELYSATTESSAPPRKPQGLAADGLSVFWANGEHAEGEGDLVQGLERPARAARRGKAAMRLSADAEPAYGVCLSGTHVFYTVRSGRVLAAPRPASTQLAGGAGAFSTVEAASVAAPSVVADRLRRPRGCAYDGDGTVFVADTEAGEVYSFAGGAAQLGARRLSPAVSVPGAYGLAVFSASAPRGGLALLLALLLSVAPLLPRSGA